MPRPRQLDELLWRCVVSIGVVAILLAATRAGAQTSGNRPLQSQAATKTTSAAPPSIVAWVDSAPIYYQDVERNTAALVRGKRIDADKLLHLQAAVLQDLIKQKLLSNYLESSQLQPTSAKIDAAVAEFSKKLQEQKQSLAGYMEQNKISKKILRNQIGQEIALQKYVSQKTTDDALQQYFVDHRPLFDGTQRRVSHIVLRPLGKTNEAAKRESLFQAQQLRGRIVAGEITFESAAEKYSDGPSRHYGGDLGYIPLQGMVSERFSEAAFALQPGEISQPVGDSFGVHLIKATELKPGQTTWQEAREPLKAAFARELLIKLMDDLHAKAKIEFVERFPHFLSGTQELAAPPAVGIAP